MRKKLVILLAVFSSIYAFSQDTFSIVAVDSITGEVGSAGASCLDNAGCGGCGGVIIISNVMPGKGGIHTQAYWLSANQNNAKSRMVAGDSPQEIINWLENNDIQNNPAKRQYGIVDFDSTGSPRSAAYTGINTDDYKGHITGPDYSIQGNILLGQQILDSMESRFLNADGDLACKLMAALQGANVPGADTRCLNEGVSSLSAFIRVAKPTDVAGAFYLDINVPQTPFAIEPIDSLQKLFDAVHSCSATSTYSPTISPFSFNVFPVPNSGIITVQLNNENTEIHWKIYDLTGALVKEKKESGGKNFMGEIDISNLPSGSYFIEVRSGDFSKTKKIILN